MNDDRIPSRMKLAVAGLLAWLAVLIPGLPAPAQDRPAGEIIKIAAVGDIMMGTENRLPADGGTGLFLACRQYFLDRDVVFGNHEGTLTDRGKPTKVSKSGRSYSFRTPPAYARFLAEAGFNMISIANNHINDYGPAGKQQTIASLEKHGLQYSGPPGTLARLNIRGQRVAMAAFHSSAHSHWLLDIPGAQTLVRRLAAENDIVIVSFHGGAEGLKALHVPTGPETFYGEKRGHLRKFAHAVIDAGADLVLGHGPHVPRAMQVYRDRLIAYSLGNFCTGQGISVKGYAGYAPLLLAEIDTDGRLVGGRILSFLQTYGQPPQLDPQNRAAHLIHQLGVQDFPRSNPVNEAGQLVPHPE